MFQAARIRVQRHFANRHHAARRNGDRVLLARRMKSRRSGSNTGLKHNCYLPFDS